MSISEKVIALRKLRRDQLDYDFLPAALEIIEPIALDLKSKKTPNGYISAEYGQCLHEVGRQAEAKPYLKEAFKMLSNDLYMVRCEPDELQHLKELTGE